VLSSHDDDRYSWNQTAAMTGDLEAGSALREVERTFAQQHARGALAVRVLPKGTPERIHQCDPEAEQILLLPGVIGGSAGATMSHVLADRAHHNDCWSGTHVLQQRFGKPAVA
jgi:hypothetical protein